MMLESLGDRVKNRRLELNLTQEELADRLGYKSRSSIQKLEAGLRNPKQSNIKALAEALETTPGYLMGWVSEDKEKSPSKDDEQLLSLFHSLKPENRAKIIDMLKMYILAQGQASE